MIKKVLIGLAITALLLVPSFAISQTLVENLNREANAGVLLLEADGNGQTYFLNFATGKKYYTGQVSPETGVALADDSVWIGMTRADLSTIPTSGSPYKAPQLRGELPETLHNELTPVNQGHSNACVAYTIGRITGLDPLPLHEQFGGGSLGISTTHANEVMEGMGYDVHTVAGWYTGTDEQIEHIKYMLMEYSYLAANIDTIRHWDEGAVYPEGRDYTPNHMFTITGWKYIDGVLYWIVYSSYGEEAGILRSDFPLLWVYGYELAQ